MVSIVPASPATTDDLTVQIDTPSIDPEGQTVTYSYAWTINGNPSSETSDTLSFEETSKNDAVGVLVTPKDGTQDGTAATASTTVVNTPPTAPGVQIAPASPEATVDDLVCSVATASTDADGDSVIYTYAWTVDAAPYTNAVTTTAPGDTVPAGDTLENEVWQCTVTADDGDVTVDGSAQVTVGAAPPVNNPIDYGRIQAPPCDATVMINLGNTLEAYAVIYHDELTDTTVGMAPVGLTVELGIGDDGTDPATDGSWTWTLATYNGDFQAGNDDEFQGIASVPGTEGTYDYAFRATLDGGASYTFIDRGDGGGNNCAGLLGTNDGYQAANAGDLTVIP